MSPEGGSRAGQGAAPRRELFGVLAIIAGTAAVAFGPGLVARFSAHPSRAECETMVARYVELKERAVSEKLDPKRYQAALEAARTATGPSLAACSTEVTTAEAECTRKAANADEFERCLR